MQVLDRRLDRAFPHEAEVAVPRAHGLTGYEVADVRSRPVDVQALLADRVGEAVPELDYLGAQDVPVEGVDRSQSETAMTTWSSPRITPRGPSSRRRSRGGS
jgi:hypothetical protein